MIGRTLGLGWESSAGAVLLLAFVLGFAYLVVASRGHRFLEADELLETAQATRRWWRPVALTLDRGSCHVESGHAGRLRAEDPTIH